MYFTIFFRFSLLFGAIFWCVLGVDLGSKWP